MDKKYKNINPLIIGLGLAGNRHLKAQLDLGIKTGVYSINPKTTNHFQKQYNHVKTIVREIPSKKMPRYISPSGIKGQKNITMQHEYLVFLQKRA